MHLELALAEPHPAARGELVGLRHLLEPQHRAVEPDRGLVLPVRHRELHMVDAGASPVLVTLRSLPMRWHGYGTPDPDAASRDGAQPTSNRWWCRNSSRRSRSRPAASSSHTRSRAGHRARCAGLPGSASSMGCGDEAGDCPPGAGDAPSPRQLRSWARTRPARDSVRSSIVLIPSASRCLLRQVIDGEAPEHVVDERRREPDVGVVRSCPRARTSC